MTARRPPLALLHLAVIAALVLVMTSAVDAREAAARKDAPRVRSSPAGDSTAVVSTVNRLHDALAAGDSAAVLALLTDDVVVLESGSVESRAEYRRHHLPADIEFARAVRPERKVSSVTVVGDVAWVASTSTTRGEFRSRPVNSVGAELMVLRRTAGGWRIAAIHWSSRTRRS